MPSARITAQRFDAAGRMVESRDPRLFERDESARPNITQLSSLTGTLLSSDSVDSGWRLQLLDAAGARHIAWDARASRTRTEYDAMRRPVALFEQAQDQAEYCAERFVYGGIDADPSFNLRHGLLRHDDGAGSRHFSGYSMTGLRQDETQHFLLSLDCPDWPVDLARRDALLEPGSGAVSRWAYSPWGESLSSIDAKGNRQAQRYSVAGHLAAVTLQSPLQANPLTLVSDIAYNALGFIERQTAGNGAISTALYDPASGYLTQLRCTRNGSFRLQDLQYTYDPVGNVMSCTDLSSQQRHRGYRRIDPVCTYCHDTLYQLIKATGQEQPGAGIGPHLPSPIGIPPVDGTLIGAYTRRYQYDAGGNLIHMQHSGENGHEHALSMVVSDRSNKALAWREGLEPGDVEQGFDGNGNLNELQPGQALSWDIRNQLAQVVRVSRANGADDVERYIYGGGGKRLRKYATQQAAQVIHIAETRYLPGIELHENSATGRRWQVLNISAGRGTVRLLHWDSDPPEGVTNDAVYYGFGNHLGSATLETDHAGQVSSREAYYPFGGTAILAARSEIEVSYKTLRYSGKERDATGLYYYGFRYLAPWLGRWVNPDPAGIHDGLNLFRFVGNNPVSRLDRDGLFDSPPSASGNAPRETQLAHLGTFRLGGFTIALIGAPEGQAPASPPAGPPALPEISDQAEAQLLHSLPISPQAVLPDISNLLDELESPEPPSPPSSPALSVISNLTSALEQLESPSPPSSPALSVISNLTSALRQLESPSPPSSPAESLFSVVSFNDDLFDSGAQASVNEPIAGQRPGTSRVLMGPPATAVRPFVCGFEGCRSAFTHRNSLTRHKHTHASGPGRHVCSAAGCDRSFNRLEHLNAHMAIHTSERRWACTHSGCGRTFAFKSSFSRHQNEMHSNKGSYACPMCRRSFVSSRRLSQHRRTSGH